MIYLAQQIDACLPVPCHAVHALLCWPSTAAYILYLSMHVGMVSCPARTWLIMSWKAVLSSLLVLVLLLVFFYFLFFKYHYSWYYYHYHYCYYYYHSQLSHPWLCVAAGAWLWKPADSWRLQHPCSGCGWHHYSLQGLSGRCQPPQVSMQFCLNLKPYLKTPFALQSASGRHIYASQCYFFLLVQVLIC